MPRLQASAVSVVLVLLLVLAASTGEPVVVAAAVAIVQLIVASAPGSPGPGRGSVTGPRFTPAVVAALVASAVAVRPQLLIGQSNQVVGQVGHVQSGLLAGVLPAVALGLVIALVGQMMRRGGRTHLVRSVALSVTLVVLAALAAGWISAVTATGGSDVVVVGAAALSVGILVWNVPGDRYLIAGLGTLAGAVAGAIAAIVINGVATPVFGVAVGATVAVLAIAGQIFGERWAASRFTRPEGWCFAAGCSVALAGPMVHLGGQLISAPLL